MENPVRSPRTEEEKERRVYEDFVYVQVNKGVPDQELVDRLHLRPRKHAEAIARFDLLKNRLKLKSEMRKPRYNDIEEVSEPDSPALIQEVQVADGNVQEAAAELEAQPVVIVV